MGRLIHGEARRRRKLLDNEMQPKGLTRAPWSVLACLARQETWDLCQSDLAKSLEIGKVMLGGPVDRLKEKGFARREFDSVDQRVKPLALTPKGMRAVSMMNVVRPIIDHIARQGTILLTQAGADMDPIEIYCKLRLQPEVQLRALDVIRTIAHAARPIRSGERRGVLLCDWLVKDARQEVLGTLAYRDDAALIAHRVALNTYDAAASMFAPMRNCYDAHNNLLQ
jgi:DNA-binding MarR family transcriptional regulator